MPVVVAHIIEGKLIPLRATLGDGSTDKVIRADILNHQTGAVLATGLVLTHQSSGSYANTSFPMPAIQYVAAVYKVFNSDGVTPSTTTDLRGEDLFQLAVSVASDNIDGVVDTDDSISGVIIGDDEISGSIDEDDSIGGSVNDDKVAGVIESNDSIDGTVEDCP